MEFYNQIETINGKSNNIGTYEVFFGDYKKMFDAPSAFNKVTVDDIKNVAKILQENQPHSRYSES